MKTPARFLGHPIHALAVNLPLGMLAMSVVVDILNVIDERAVWKDAAYVMIGLGLLAALVVAVPGLIDWLSIPPTHEAKQIGLMHLASNVTGLALFAVSWYLRYDASDSWSWLAFAFSLGGVAALSLGGWLGGEMVYRHGIGMDLEPDAAARMATEGMANRR
jgi:uncharacterized membrane protein